GLAVHINSKRERGWRLGDDNKSATDHKHECDDWSSEFQSTAILLSCVTGIRSHDPKKKCSRTKSKWQKNNVIKLTDQTEFRKKGSLPNHRSQHPDATQKTRQCDQRIWNYLSDFGWLRRRALHIRLRGSAAGEIAHNAKSALPTRGKQS